MAAYFVFQGSFILCYMEDRNIAYSLRINYKEMTYSFRAIYTHETSGGTEDKLYQIEVFRDDMVE